MFSSLFRPRKGNPRIRLDAPNTPSPGPSNRDYARRRHATADWTEADDDEEDVDDENDPDFGPAFRDRGPDEEGTRGQATPVLPLFSAAHLEGLPVYSITHAIRILVQTRTETTLTWEQLRSPQVSQFLVKPMQQQIRTQHFSRATLYALMANCLQFAKEGQLYPGNAGASSTRAKVCELLAIKLLKEYTTRELIDALSYDFYPLQGVTGPPAPLTARDAKARSKQSAARTSTLEVAIRASAKHFLAHPLIIQQLEAIWNGAISFDSAADNLHRPPPSSTPSSSDRSRTQSDVRTPLLGTQLGKEEPNRLPIHYVPARRTVQLYDPRNASLMKLSRLRVPRYRHFLSTCSLAILIGLFIAVLIQRSIRITSLELFFWFWSAGFMLDELVGFTEQGFSLYMMSFWNIFDLGILVLLIAYYCMRIYGVFLIDPLKWNEMAYDVLAANAILLVPRIFSVLDHYQYFSQLLIAFRLMALDLVAVFILILVACSGFFVFFTLSRNESDASEVAFKIFQILMGFSPAAWDVWPVYNWLGRLLMALFLIMCHFVVVTILITVLTNSFMSIASNATEEHQFLFAINTISMVKNDALFSYIAPGNIFAWMLMPLRYCMPLRHFVWLNRAVIKATHWPLLFCIYFYERFFLAPTMFEPTDLVENPGRGKFRGVSLADPTTRASLWSPGAKIREESVAGFQKDRALEEVFRRVPDLASLRHQRRHERRKTQTAIRNWMDQHDDYASPSANWPTMNSRPAVPEWQRRLSLTRDRPRRFRQMSDVRSAASDPADLLSNSAYPAAPFFQPDPEVHEEEPEIKDQTDADGDDELVTNDEDEDDNVTNHMPSRRTKSPNEGEDYFTRPIASRFANKASSSLGSTQRGSLGLSPRMAPLRQSMHSRTLSTNTILFNPQNNAMQRPPSMASSASPEQSGHARSRPMSGRQTPAETPGRRSPRRPMYMATKARPIAVPRELSSTAPNRNLPRNADSRPGQRTARRVSSVDLDAPSDLGGVNPMDDFGAVPSSFATQMAMATGMLGKGAGTRRDDDRMSRLVLARMKTLEESFADVVREMRVMRTSGLPTRDNSGDDGSLKATTIEIAQPADRLKRTKSAKTPGQVLGNGLGSKRPGSRKSLKEEEPLEPGSGATTPRRKGKGKQVQLSDGDDSDDEGGADDKERKRALIA